MCRVFLYNFFDHPKLMGVLPFFRIKNTGVIYSVYTHLSMGVDNIIVFHNYSHMYDVSLLIIKKSKITWFALFNKTQNFSFHGLLSCKTRYGIAIYSINHLSQTGVINAKWSLSAP